MSEATATTHLSIGEVLSLVQEDFPDVTISKIRFLESQGLIAPERTGSGYRKFYGADIERLRWILRQQRDNFLPLKVIKKMLDDGVDLSGTMETQPTLWANTGEASDGGGGSAVPGSVGASGAAPPGDAIGSTSQVAAGLSSRSGDEADDEADDVERAAYRSPSHPAVASAAPKSGSSRRSTAAAGSRAPEQTPPRVTSKNASAGRAERSRSATPDPPSGSAATATTGDETTSPRPDRTRISPGSSTEDRRATTPESGGASAQDPAPPGSSDPERPAHSTPADVVAALQEDPRSARRRRQKAAGRQIESEIDPGTGPASGDATAAAGATGAPVPTTPGPAASLAAGASRDALFSADELCENTGISAELLADLEQYGLVVAASLGGRSAYDSGAVDVARMAAKYAELGVEPRHLRMYKVSAEREAGFVEQLVVPLIKQRNPAARQLAVDRCDELIAMGAELHVALLRRQLRRIIGG